MTRIPEIPNPQVLENAGNFFKIEIMKDLNRNRLELSMGRNYWNAELIRWTVDSKAANYYLSLSFYSFSLASQSQLAVLAVNTASQVCKNTIEMQKKVMLGSFLERKIKRENIANNRWIWKRSTQIQLAIKRNLVPSEKNQPSHRDVAAPSATYHVFLFVFDIKAVFVFNVLPCWPISRKIFLFCVHFAILKSVFSLFAFSITAVSSHSLLGVNRKWESLMGWKFIPISVITESCFSHRCPTVSMPLKSHSCFRSYSTLSRCQ